MYSRYSGLYEFDIQLLQSRQGPIAGVDEAGRGPLAGPVVAAAVILDLTKPIDGIYDSKGITKKRREQLFEKIVSLSRAWSVGIASVEEIDRYNILKASLLAMHRALEGLKEKWSLALIDGNKGIDALPQSMQQTVVGGDGRSASVAAASIIAKVTRDEMMSGYHKIFPAYYFNMHKGYPTALHRSMIRKYGLCTIHRKTFCQNLISQTELMFV